MLNLNIEELFNDAIRTVAMPIILKYQKEMGDDNEMLEPQKKDVIDVDENGCVII